MPPQRLAIIATLIVILACLAGVMVWMVKGDAAPTPPPSDPASTDTEAAGDQRTHRPPATPPVMQSGFDQPGRVVTTAPANTESLSNPDLAADQTHPHVIAARDGARDETKLDRVSALAIGASFDHSQWANADQRDAYVATYVNEVGPQRVFDTKTPGEGVRGTRTKGETEFEVQVDGTLTLQLVTDPGAPSNWLSNGLGVFKPSGLTSTTVVADESGVATVTWHAVKGTIGDVVVMASSPTRSGVQRYFITVFDPNAPGPSSD